MALTMDSEPNSPTLTRSDEIRNVGRIPNIKMRRLEEGFQEIHAIVAKLSEETFLPREQIYDLFLRQPGQPSQKQNSTNSWNLYNSYLQQFKEEELNRTFANQLRNVEGS